MALDKKEAFLARQWANKAAVKNCHLLENSATITSINLPSFEVSTSFTEQASAAVRRSLLLSEKG